MAKKKGLRTTTSGLQIPYYQRQNFYDLAFKTTYKNFLGTINTLNELGVEHRKAIENEWTSLVQAKWLVWQNSEMEVPDKNDALNRALEQISGPHIDKWWMKRSQPNPTKLPTAQQKGIQFAAQPVPQDDVISELGIALPEFYYDQTGFEYIAFKLSYKGFLYSLDAVNSNRILDPKLAARAWKLVLEKKFNDWKGFQVNLVEEEKQAVFDKALLQANGMPGFNVNSYWTEKLENHKVSEMPMSEVIQEDVEDVEDEEDEEDEEDDDSEVEFILSRNTNFRVRVGGK